MKKKLAALVALCLTLSMTAMPAGAELSLEDGRQLLQTYYVREIPPEILNRPTLGEVLDGLGDPYTFYMTGEEYKGFLDMVNGEKLVGIGVALSTAEDVGENGARIMSVLPKSPAEEAGLQVGDWITAVNGQPVKQIGDMSAVLRGEVGTEVVLDVLKKDSQDRQTVTLTRQEVHVPVTVYKTVRDAGWINVLSFGLDAADVMAEGMDAMKDKAALWVVDLRDNPGGISQISTKASALFTDYRPMLYFRDKPGTIFGVTTQTGVVKSQDKPLMILTNSETASAAECFTATARDYALGISLGQRSFGKGIAQTVFDKNSHPDLFEDDCLKVTTHQLYSPVGTTTHKLGVIPTVLLSEQNTQAAAELMSTAEPGNNTNFVRLELADYFFYIDLTMAQSDKYRAAMTELLGALPPSASLSLGAGREWQDITASDLAQRMGLKVKFRTFSDVEDSQYRREIDTLAAYDLIEGVGNGTFQPEQLLTRAQVCAMLANALSLPVPKDVPTFTDVSANAWYADAVAAAVSAGLASGCGDGTFRPNDVVTYEELVAFVSGAAVYGNLSIEELNGRDPYVDELGACLDYPKWAHRAVRNLNTMQVLLDGTTPEQPVSREMAAALMCRAMEKIKLIWPE